MPVAQGGNAFPAKTENLSRLGSLGNCKNLFAVQGGHIDLVAQGRLNKGDGHLTDDVGVVAPEKVVRRHMDENVEIAGGAAVSAGLAFTGQPQPGAVVHPGRNFDGDFFGNLDQPVAPALSAGMGNGLAASLAIRTGCANGEKTLAAAHLTRALAVGAGFGIGSGLAAFSFAGIAAFGFGHIDFGFGAESRPA